MENQGFINKMDNKNNYFKKVIVFAAVILILVALATLSDFTGNGSKPSGIATLSWDANMEPDLAGYKIYYGASKRNSDCPPAGYSGKLDVGKTAAPEKPNYKIENLDNGKTYYFSITSYDTSDNESCFQKEVSKAFPKL